MDGIQGSRVAIVMHAYAPPNGLVLELTEYLNRHGARVLFVVHPFPTARMPRCSTLKIIEQGRTTQELNTFAPRGPGLIFHILDILFTLYLLWRARAKIDLFIGLDNLNALAGILAKRLGLVKSVVFYVIDYVPQRFANRWLNSVYHWIDRLCCRQSDVIWNVSGAMMDARRSKWGSLDGVAPSIVVPWGCRFEQIERLHMAEINRHEVIFLGSLVAEQGIHLLLETWPTVLASVPDARLVIVGGGEQETALKELARSKGIANCVKFMGFVQEDAEIERILARGAIGVAPYREDKDSFKYFCDPSKIKSYLACGLPVVITRVPPVALAIHDAEAGIAIRYDGRELSDSIIRLLTQDDVYRRYRENAIRFAAQYSWQKVFDAAFSQTIQRTGHVASIARGLT